MSPSPIAPSLVGLLVTTEVENGRRVHPLDAQGLRAFHEDHPESGALLLYLGKERAVFGVFEGNVGLLPVEDLRLGLDPARGALPGIAGS